MKLTMFAFDEQIVSIQARSVSFHDPNANMNQLWHVSSIASTLKIVLSYIASKNGQIVQRVYFELKLNFVR